MNDRIDVRLENLSAPSADQNPDATQASVLSERLKRRQAYAQKRGVELQTEVQIVGRMQEGNAIERGELK